MKKFLLSLYVLYNIILYDCEIAINGIVMYITNFVLKILSYVGFGITAFLKTIWIFLKWIDTPIRKMTYELAVVVFIACLFVTIKFPHWKYTDFSWLIFFFSLMLTIVLMTIHEK